MSDNKSFSEKIKNGEIKYKQSSTNQKKSLKNRAVTLPFKILGAFLGIDKRTITTSKEEWEGNGSSPASYQTPQQTFREQYRFNPEQWAIKEAQAEAYHDLVDGRGDHEDCDCDHEH